MEGRFLSQAHLVIADLMLLQGELTEVTKWMPPSTFSSSPISQASGDLRLLLLRG
jgi:hypothetical protein